MSETGASSAGRFSLSSTCYSRDFEGAQTALTIITPDPGKKLVVKQVYASTSTVNIDITLAFATSAETVFKLYTAQKATATGNIVCGVGAVDEVLSLTCGANTFISVAYDEIN